MATYSVELFGLSHLFPGRHVVQAELDGKVIVAGENRLGSHSCFNVNGRFHLDDYEAKVKAADHILIVTFALGG